MNIFTEEEIQNAKNHKCSGSDDSLLVNYCMKYIWDSMVELFPMWLAPNLMTLVGFLLEIISFSISLSYSHAMSIGVPSWVCVLDGVCALIYQTLGNLDGRQARRTGSASALQQFFGYGCHAITGVMEPFKLSVVLHFGQTVKSYTLIICTSIGFFLTSWEELVAHKFYLGYLNGPDEGLFLIGCVEILAGINPEVALLANEKIWEICFLFLFCVTVGVIFKDVLMASLEDCKNLKVALISLLPFSISIALSLGSIYLAGDYINTYFMILSPLILQFEGQLILANIIMKRPLTKLFSWPVILEWIALSIPLFYRLLFISNPYWVCFLLFLLLVMVIYDARVIIGLSAGLGVPVFTIAQRPQADGAVVEQPKEANDETYVLDDVAVDVGQTDGSDQPETA